MAEKTFVIYAAAAGTSTARPVIEFFNEDESFVPVLTDMGYPSGEAAYVGLDQPFAVTDTQDEATGRAFTIDPATKVVSETTFARTDVATAQREVSIQIADLIREWDWTQRVDARVTKSTQDAYAGWINALENIPGHPLWNSDPKGIAFPARPALTPASTTVGDQIAKAEWTDDAVIGSQKLTLANWATLQPIWGFDRPDPGLFATNNASTSISFATGRSGDRALRATADGSVATAFVRSQPLYSMALSSGDYFLIEAWVRASKSTDVWLGIRTFLSKTPTADFDGGTVETPTTVSTSWTRIIGYVQVPSGTPVRWGTAQVAFSTGSASTWIEVDGLTITRVPRLMNAYAQANTVTAITSTGSGIAAQEMLVLPFQRAGFAATVKLSTTSRVIPGNATSDAMRLHFWLTVTTPSVAETVLATWSEYAPVGQWTHRSTGLEWTDAAAVAETATYRLRASKTSGVGVMSLAHRSLSAILLPKV